MIRQKSAASITQFERPLERNKKKKMKQVKIRKNEDKEILVQLARLD